MRDTLIRLNLKGDIEPDEPAYMEVHWLVEGGKLTGIRAAIKPTQVRVIGGDWMFVCCRRRCCSAAPVVHH